MSQTALEMTSVVSVKPKWIKKLPPFGTEREGGFGTKRVASTERPGTDPGSAWHLLSGEDCLGAEGESRGQEV